MGKTDSNHRFGLALPGEWEDQTVHMFMGPESSGVQHSLTMVVDMYLETDDLAEYADQQTEVFLSSLSGAELIKNEQVTLDSGKPAWVAVCKTVPSADQVLLQRRVYVLANNVGYIFTANFSRKTIKTVGKQVLQIINSLVPTG